MATKAYVPRAERGPDVKPARMSLMDIGEDALKINDVLREAEGELTLELEAALDSLLASGAQALDAAAWVVRQLTAEATLCKDEASRYAARARSADAQAEALKGRMMFAVEAAFGGKLKTERNTIWTQSSAPTVSFEVAEDADLEKIAQENGVFVRRKLELDKVALKNYWEAGGALPAEIKVTEKPGTRYLRIR